MKDESHTPRPAYDWSQWYWPGPRRVFSEAELARAGQQPWPRLVDQMILVGLIGNGASVAQLTPPGQGLGLALAALALTAIGLAGARRLWRRPERRPMNQASYALIGVQLAALIVAKLLHVPKDQQLMPMLVCGSLTVLLLLGWWMVVVLRVQQIDGRLAELDEQDRAIRLARRLATAQIQPHFLFNTLASVQHWVDTQDPRAAPTLRAFTQYLRSTLPIFERETLPLADELQIVRDYLTVMQARLGERLAWRIDAEPALLDAPALPPGTLLTLVENAIAHGIEPALRGGRIEVRASTSAAGQSILEVSDDGAGLCGEAPEGIGLANTRARLLQQFGPRARLTLHSSQPGCLARIEIDPA